MFDANGHDAGKARSHSEGKIRIYLQKDRQDAHSQHGQSLSRAAPGCINPSGLIIKNAKTLLDRTYIPSEKGEHNRVNTQTALQLEIVLKLWGEAIIIAPCRIKFRGLTGILVFYQYDRHEIAAYMLEFIYRIKCISNPICPKNGWRSDEISHLDDPSALDHKIVKSADRKSVV